MKNKYDLINWSELERIINKFIKIERARPYDSILAIAKGGLIPGVMLAHRLEVKDFHIIDIKRNSSSEPYSKKITPIFQNFNYNHLKNKNILIVDDIAGTGQTLIELKNKFNENGIINYEVFVVVKFDGDYSPDENLKINFFGKVCKNWVIFPWEKQLKR